MVPIAAPEDDATIQGETKLFRRVHISHIVPDEDTGIARVSTAAFKSKGLDLSIFIETTLVADGLEPLHCIRNHAQHQLVAITAAEARSVSQIVYRDPAVDYRSHGIVWGQKPRAVLLAFVGFAEWIIPSSAPTNDELRELNSKIHR